MYINPGPVVRRPKKTPTVPTPKASGKPANNTRRLNIINMVVSSGLMGFSFYGHCKRSEKFRDSLKVKKKNAKKNGHFKRG
jgi:hypothetical protein